MSPEQPGGWTAQLTTGWLYSLGITFYEMLTRQLPFEATDPLELTCHIAKTPVPLPKQLNPEIPQVVSEIVMKLLAKTAEDRYQSALGLKADLEACLSMLQESGEILTHRWSDGFTQPISHPAKTLVANKKLPL